MGVGHNRTFATTAPYGHRIYGPSLAAVIHRRQAATEPMRLFEQAIRNWITPSHEHDRHRRGRGFGSKGRGYAARCRDDGRLPAY